MPCVRSLEPVAFPASVRALFDLIFADEAASFKRQFHRSQGHRAVRLLIVCALRHSAPPRLLRCSVCASPPRAANDRVCANVFVRVLTIISFSLNFQVTVSEWFPLSPSKGRRMCFYTLQESIKVGMDGTRVIELETYEFTGDGKLIIAAEVHPEPPYGEAFLIKVHAEATNVSKPLLHGGGDSCDGAATGSEEADGAEEYGDTSSSCHMHIELSVALKERVWGVTGMVEDALANKVNALQQQWLNLCAAHVALHQLGVGTPNSAFGEIGAPPKRSRARIMIAEGKAATRGDDDDDDIVGGTAEVLHEGEAPGSRALRKAVIGGARRRRKSQRFDIEADLAADEAEVDGMELPMLVRTSDEDVAEWFHGVRGGARSSSYSAANDLKSSSVFRVRQPAASALSGSGHTFVWLVYLASALAGAALVAVLLMQSGASAASWDGGWGV